MTVGTVAYAAPEQLMGEQVDARADQYALAASAYHLLTGTPLFQHSNPAVVISKHLSTPPPEIGTRRPALTDLGPVFSKALAKAPEDRYETCGSSPTRLRHGCKPWLTSLARQMPRRWHSPRQGRGINQGHGEQASNLRSRSETRCRDRCGAAAARRGHRPGLVRHARYMTTFLCCVKVAGPQYVYAHSRYQWRLESRG